MVGKIQASVLQFFGSSSKRACTYVGEAGGSEWEERRVSFQLENEAECNHDQISDNSYGDPSPCVVDKIDIIKKSGHGGNDNGVPNI